MHLIFLRYSYMTLQQSGQVRGKDEMIWDTLETYTEKNTLTDGNISLFQSTFKTTHYTYEYTFHLSQV